MQFLKENKNKKPCKTENMEECNLFITISVIVFSLLLINRYTITSKYAFTMFFSSFWKKKCEKSTIDIFKTIKQCEYSEAS